MTEKKTYTEEEVNEILKAQQMQMTQSVREAGYVRELRLAITVLRREQLSEAVYLEDLLNTILRPPQPQPQKPAEPGEKDKDEGTTGVDEP